MHHPANRDPPRPASALAYGFAPPQDQGGDAGEATMRGFKGEQVLMRIHVSEQDRFHGKPLFEQVVELLRQRGCAGATVLRGLMGFGASSRLHDARSEYLFADLPLVIECVDTEERIRGVLPELDRMIGGGLITLERVKVIMYRPHRAGEAEDRTTPDDWSLDITGAWPAQGPPGSTAPRAP